MLELQRLIRTFRVNVVRLRRTDFPYASTKHVAKPSISNSLSHATHMSTRTFCASVCASVGAAWFKSRDRLQLAEINPFCNPMGLVTLRSLKTRYRVNLKEVLKVWGCKGHWGYPQYVHGMVKGIFIFGYIQIYNYCKDRLFGGISRSYQAH